MPIRPRSAAARVNVFLGASLVGTAALLGGLIWDALLHADEPGLAAHEGIFTLTNPSHALLMAGIVVIVVGVVGALDANLRAGGGGRRRPGFRVAASGAVVVVMSTLLATAGWAMSRTHIEPNVSALADPRGGPAPGGHPGAHDNAPPPGAEPDGGQAHGGQHDPGGGATPAATPEQRAEADALVVATTEAIAGYRDEATARAAGFRPIQSPTSRYVHYVNFAYLADSDVVDPLRPESLVYRSTADGPVLEAAMFILPSVDSPIPAVGGLAQSWHRHDDLCFSTATAMIVGVNDARSCPPGSVNQVTPPMLHVWIVDHPGGPFAGL